MRICYLSAAEIPSRLANGVHVMKMCTAFVRHGHDVVLFARRGSEASADPFDFYGCEPNFRIKTCSGARPGLLGKIFHPFKVAYRVRCERAPDVLYARHLYSLAAVAPMGIPMIFEAHVLPQSMVQRRLQAWLFKRNNFLRLVTISDALSRDYQTLFPWLPDNKLLVAHDGADLPEIIRDPVAGRRDRLRVGYVGSLYPGKGMEIVAAVAERMPHVEFHVVGGSESDLRLWKARAAHANLHYRGFVPHGQLQAVYAGFDIVLAPLQYRVSTSAGTDDIVRWTSPLKIFEYMAHSKPIVCSDLPVLREILTHGRDALLVTPDSPDDWAEAIQTLDRDPALRAALGAAAKEEIKRRYLWLRRAASVLANLDCEE